MAIYQIRDLIKVRQIEKVNLRDSDTIDKSSLFDDLPQNSINLSSLKSEQKQIWSSQKNNYIDSIFSTQKKDQQFYLIPSESFQKAPIFRLLPIFNTFIAGIFILFVINIFNVFTNTRSFTNNIISSASDGYDNLLFAVDQTKTLNHQKAQTSFQSAINNFNEILENLSFLNSVNSLAKNSNLDSYQNLFNAGKSISEAGALFTKSAENLMEWPTLFIQANKDIKLGKDNYLVSEKGSQSSKLTTSLTDQLSKDLQNVNIAIQKVSEAKDFLNKVNIYLIPKSYQSKLSEIKTNLDSLDKFLNNLSNYFPAILNLLGDRYPHRYLILLQNDTEARPTGGFIGSLMIMDINDGKITKADFHDVYHFDGQNTEKILAPEEISMITDNWGLRDSNYSPDFQISAEKAAWFLQNNKGPSVDTIIAINQSAITDLLEELGPINVSPLKSDLDSDNFQLMLSYLIESKYFGDKNPKVILEKTIEAFKNKLIESDDPSLILNTLLKLIKDQKILLYSRDPEVQSFFDFYGLTPHQIATTNEDFLQVLNISTGGNKSDLFIKQNLIHTTFISPNGEINDELTITKKHTWSNKDLLNFQMTLKIFGFNQEIPDYLQYILGAGENKSMVKVYVPLGTKLENSIGVDMNKILIRSDSDLQKTYFLIPMEVSAGEESTVTIRYSLPEKLYLKPADIYRFIAQKQIAINDSQFKKVLELSPSLSLIKTNRSDTQNENKSEEVINLKGDYRFDAVIAK